MANANGNNRDLLARTAPTQGKSAGIGALLKAQLEKDGIRKRFEEMLGKKAPGFISSMITVANNNALLKKADPMTIISAGAIAATLDLPIDPNLGFAYIVPYRDGDIFKAQFQLGYRGYVQLALRTGLYKRINVTEVYEGELKHYNRLTGDVEFNDDPAASDVVVGYYAYFRMLNGFEQHIYMTRDQVMKHAKKYSKSFNSRASAWSTNFDEMACKTVLRRLLSKWGLLSIEMQTALNADQAVVKMDGDGEFDFDHEDNTIDVDGKAVDAETGEIKEEPPAPDPVPPVDPQADFSLEDLVGPDGEEEQEPEQHETLAEKHRRMTKNL